MKKLYVFLAALFISVAALAENAYPTTDAVEVNNFKSNWFIGVDGGVQVGSNYNGIVWNSYTPGAAITVGKWITPVVGLRGQVNAGHYSTLSKADYTVNKQLGGSAFADVMFNLSNWKYTGEKVWNFIPYVGYGRVASQEDYKSWGRWAWNFGIDNQFKVAKHASIDLELFAKRYNGYGAPGGYNIVPGRNWNVGALVGVVFNLGKTGWKHVPNLPVIITLYENKLEALEKTNDENLEKLDEALKNVRTDTVYVVKTVTEYKPVDQSVFFAADSYDPESKKDLRNLQGFVDYLNSHEDAVAMVYGYADSKTGSKDYNWELSVKRAEAVKAYLVEAGVREEQLKPVACGGVDELNPYNYNRRVVVSIK